jgi:hypothetical protein
MIKRTTALLLGLFLALNTCLADEGMWLMLHIQRLNYADMQKAGLELTAEELYSVNNSSLKDAIVVLDGGSCTAEMISKDGLMLTNHHCAYDVIQSSSSIEKNYLEQGFWAMNRDQEIYAPGKTASFLVKMEDVTAEVLAELKDDMSEEERDKAVDGISDSIVKRATEDYEYYDAKVKSMFNGNRYYLFVYETYKDIRLVAAPPEAIGKFGGDTDNWMWPRHTGDFSMLRIYADKDGKPAAYSKDNVPLKPRHHLPISLKGVKPNDFAMIMGYPGSTDRYLTSYGIKNEIATTHAARIKIRGKRLAMYKEDMDQDEAVRLKYASKYAGISNYYKNSQGMVSALTKLKVAEHKKAEEEEFAAWVNADESRKAKYGDALELIKNAMEQGQETKLAISYCIEALYFTEVIQMGWRSNTLYQNLLSEKANEESIAKQSTALRATAVEHFKDYNLATDKKAFIPILEIYYKDIPAKYHPEAFKMVTKKFKGDFSKYADYVYKRSMMADSTKLFAFLENPSAKALEKDPGFQLSKSVRNLYFNVLRGEFASFSDDLTKGNRLFLNGLMKMQEERKFYPDANSTMRLTYGNVRDYKARDAVQYDYYTTLAGVMEKEDPTNFEFIVPEKLKTLYENKDYGDYAENGELIVNFLTTNDITGGNSGSPVINGKGELIGCAFDGNWEALSGDVAFEQNLQRTIICDIRYILFIVDKFAGASHLIDEMTLVK